MRELNIRLKINSIILKNFATFDDQTIAFSNGLNSIIGETGSGKSLILDALHLLLGARADKRIVRKNAEFSSIEAYFDCDDFGIKQFFDHLGYPMDNDEIVIKRIIYTNGKSKNFINFQSCNVQTLQIFAKRFVDIVGQFENQKLLSPSYQLVLLDNFCNNSQLITNYQERYKQYVDVSSKITLLLEQKSQQAQRLDYLNFQIDELNKLDPNPEEELELISLKESIINAEEKNKILGNIDNLINNDDGILQLMSKLDRLLSSASKYFRPEIYEKSNQAHELLNDISYELNKQANILPDESELDNVIDKLDQYQKLKRKFSTDTNGLLNLLKDFTSEKEIISNTEYTIDKLKKSQLALKEECLEQASYLHKKRSDYAQELSNKLTNSVRNLNMIGSNLKIEVIKSPNLSLNGVSEVSFIAETNPGEGFFKIKDIASGGELSRILLALRQILSTKDTISIFLFDEIDAGIGGETALKIGNALKEVSSNSQVIAITHLPQIANFSEQLIVVNKKIEEFNGEKRTLSGVYQIEKSLIKKYVEQMIPLNLN